MSLTIGGSFEARTKALSGEIEPTNGDVVAVGGFLSVDLQSLETGIGLRDRHLRSNYLEIERSPGFGVATLDNIEIENLKGKTAFRGRLTLHGQQKKSRAQPNCSGTTKAIVWRRASRCASPTFKSRNRDTSA